MTGVAKTETVDAQRGDGLTTGSADLPPEADTDRRGYYLELLLVSFAGLLLEISYTRIVSFKLYYYYTYLVIGLALLGIGFGGVLVTISRRLREMATEALLMWCLLLGALRIAVGYFVIALMPLDTFAIWDYGSFDSFANLALLLVLCLGLFVPFVAVGVVVSTLFGRRPERIGRLYFADLVGAGLACAIVVALLGWFGPLTTIFLAGLILGALGLRLAIRQRSKAVGFAGVLTALLAVAVVVPSVLPDLRLDESKRRDFPEHTIYTKWSPIFRVDVKQATPDVRVLYHDGLIGSAVHKWDGKQASLAGMGFDTDIRSLPFAVLGDAPKRELIIGAAGGNEVLSSLFYDAGHVDAVELNPVTYHLVTDDYADYSGHLAEHPKVNFVNGDGRSYLARSKDGYDLVWFPAPDSYAATNAANAGAFVLSESYLYTSDAIKDSLEHLAPDGIIATQFGERRLREQAEPHHALRRHRARGARRPRRDRPERTHHGGHVAHRPRRATLSTIVVKRTPFTDAEIERFVGALGNVEGSVLRYAPGHAAGQHGQHDRHAPHPSSSTRSSTPTRTTSPRSPTTVRSSGTSVRSATCSRTSPSSISTSDWEDTVGERVLLLLLAIATLMAAVFLLLPFVAIRRDWSDVAAQGHLLRLLRHARPRVHVLRDHADPAAHAVPRLPDVLAHGHADVAARVRRARRPAERADQATRAPEPAVPVRGDRGTHALLPVRAARRSPTRCSAAPSRSAWSWRSWCSRRSASASACSCRSASARWPSSSPHPDEYVAWGWAVNGFSSVIGAVLTTILAMTFGFNVVLGLALLAYLIAIVTLRVLLKGPASSALPTPA